MRLAKDHSPRGLDERWLECPVRTAAAQCTVAITPCNGTGLCVEHGAYVSHAWVHDNGLIEYMQVSGDD